MHHYEKYKKLAWKIRSQYDKSLQILKSTREEALILQIVFFEP